MKKLTDIQKKLKAPKGQHNSFGNYDYRSCEDILEGVKPLLGDCVLTLSDEIVYFPASGDVQIVTLTDNKGNKYTEVVNQDRFYVKATATIKDDKESVTVSAYAREEETKKGMDSAQITGSASSYARKYALNGLFLIDDTKDADTRDNTVKPVSKKTYTPKATYPPTEVKEKATPEQFEGMLRRLKSLLGEKATIDEYLATKGITKREWVTKKQAGFFISLMDFEIDRRNIDKAIEIAVDN